MSENNTVQTNRNNGAVEQMNRRAAITPLVDVYENADEILVVADVPGARSDSIMVKMEKNELYLHARREEEPGPAGTRAADYIRTFVVPRGIDPEKISADMNAGVLRIHLPKSESLKPRRIEVKAA
jgi:HSP20 family protein